MPEALEGFLEAFPTEVAALVRGRAGHATIVIDDAAPAFRLDPAAGLTALRGRITPLVLSENEPGEIVWCYSGDINNGLDDFEIAAILGRWLDIDLVHQSSTGPGKRVVIGGRLRRELVAVAFVAAADTSSSQLGRFLAACGESQLPAIVLISAAQLEGVLPESELGLALGRHQRAGGGIGLLVRDAQSESAFSDPTAQLEPFERLGLSVRIAMFERGEALAPEALDRFMRVTGLECDLSVPAASPSAHELVRSGAYAGPSPYRPQPFDLRVPWFHTEPGMWIEVPMFPAGDEFAREFRDHLQWPGDDELVKRLDSGRMAAFYRASAISPELEREYPQYRIYNWPRPAPGRRVTVLDAGVASAERKAHVDRLIAPLRELRATIVNQDDLIDAARCEVVERYGLSSATAIDVQHATHAYLADIPRYGALRQDYADFARFAPAVLGTTLEIGSGYGVLAWALSTRASRYVCADLDPRMFSGLRPDLGQSGIVADAHQMPFVEGAFDSIVANNVIEHFYDPLAALREIRRVLRPGGRLLALLPFDALENRHDLPAHLWKIDEAGLHRAFGAADLELLRLEVVNLHELGVSGAFPSCHGFVAMVDAQRPSSGRTSVAAPTTRPDIVRRTPQESERAGRSWPSVREQVRFEEWEGKHVVTIDADPDDVREFRAFGAQVTEVSAATSAWNIADGVADLVYTFLGISERRLPQLKGQLLRVLKPAGVAVIAFRHRDGLRHLLRVRGYFGKVCDLDRLIGRASVAVVADSANDDNDYVSVDAVEAALHGVTRCTVTVSGLTREDFGAEFSRELPEEFWAWLNRSFGRFVIARIER